MRKFAIRSELYEGKDLAILYYDEEKKEYEIEIPETTKSQEAPLIIAAFIEKGQRKIGKEWSLRWVQERVTPPNRQNIGQILKANHMTEYDEFKFLVKNEGRSCQDECYIVEM
ncbi:MAG: hypothetical protein K2O03_02110 [Lachnospiraceae bacterium]|nr:hypothetical protein [Lachnospiraceae bacterium]